MKKRLDIYRHVNTPRIFWCGGRAIVHIHIVCVSDAEKTKECVCM